MQQQAASITHVIAGSRASHGLTVELFKTGRIALPRPDAQHLPRIEQGELAHNAVTEEIERLLGEIENAAAGSSLPDNARP